MATYTNSSLVTYKKISPMKDSTRVHSKYNPKGVIDKITIHHMAGNLSIETCGNVFQYREASSNYGIGSDGRIGMYVEEKHRSWASSSPANDYRAVTIEVANDGGASSDWHVSDKALAALIKLCVDICKRNGIKELNYTGDSSGNLTRHNMFVATTCPGPYLQSKFEYIEKQVNAQLKAASSTSSSTTKKPASSTSTTTSTKKTAITNGAKLKLSKAALYGSSTSKTKAGTVTGTYYIWSKTVVNGKVRITNSKDNVGRAGQVTGWIKESVAKKGLVSTTATKTASTKPVSTALKVGDKVKVASGAYYTTGQKVPTWVRLSTLYVREIQGDNIVVSTLKSGAITGIINKKYLTKK